MEAVETGNGTIPQPAEEGCGFRPGKENCRQRSWPLAHSGQSGLTHCAPECLFRLARAASTEGIVQLCRIAVCGPACTVVWQGRTGDRSPYADLSRSLFGTNQKMIE